MVSLSLEKKMKQGKRLTEFCQENTQVIANTLFQQHKRQLYTWTPPNGQYRNQIDYIHCSQSWRSSIHTAKTRPGGDCGSYHELLIAKLKLKLKKIGKTSRPFRYGLNQVPHIHLNAESKRIAWRDKAFLSDQCKKIDGKKNRMGKTRDLFKKIRGNQGNISCKDGYNKGQKWYGPNRSRRY